jgi:hypothetical protein
VYNAVKDELNWRLNNDDITSAAVKSAADAN